MRFPTMEVVRALMEYGADPYLGSENGATPMQAALESNKTAIVNLMSCKLLSDSAGCQVM